MYRRLDENVRKKSFRFKIGVVFLGLAAVIIVVVFFDYYLDRRINSTRMQLIDAPAYDTGIRIVFPRYRSSDDQSIFVQYLGFATDQLGSIDIVVENLSDATLEFKHPDIAQPTSVLDVDLQSSEVGFWYDNNAVSQPACLPGARCTFAVTRDDNQRVLSIVSNATPSTEREVSLRFSLYSLDGAAISSTEIISFKTAPFYLVWAYVTFKYAANPELIPGLAAVVIAIMAYWLDRNSRRRQERAELLGELNALWRAFDDSYVGGFNILSALSTLGRTKKAVNQQGGLPPRFHARHKETSEKIAAVLSQKHFQFFDEIAAIVAQSDASPERLGEIARELEASSTDIKLLPVDSSVFELLDQTAVVLKALGTALEQPNESTIEQFLIVLEQFWSRFDEPSRNLCIEMLARFSNHAQAVPNPDGQKEVSAVDPDESSTPAIDDRVDGEESDSDVKATVSLYDYLNGRLSRYLAESNSRALRTLIRDSRMRWEPEVALFGSASQTNWPSPIGSPGQTQRRDKNQSFGRRDLLTVDAVLRDPFVFGKFPEPAEGIYNELKEMKSTFVFDSVPDLHGIERTVVPYYLHQYLFNQECFLVWAPFACADQVSPTCWLGHALGRSWLQTVAVNPHVFFELASDHYRAQVLELLLWHTGSHDRLIAELRVEFDRRVKSENWPVANQPELRSPDQVSGSALISGRPAADSLDGAIEIIARYLPHFTRYYHATIDNSKEPSDALLASWLQLRPLYWDIDDLRLVDVDNTVVILPVWCNFGWASSQIESLLRWIRLFEPLGVIFKVFLPYAPYASRKEISRVMTKLEWTDPDLERVLLNWLERAGERTGAGESLKGLYESEFDPQNEIIRPAENSLGRLVQLVSAKIQYLKNVQQRNPP